MKIWRYIVPNFFTAVSLSMGMASIVVAAEGNLEMASWLILWSVLLDKADGTAARLLGATSGFGSEFDSMADLVSFGLAPAFLVYATGRQVWDLRMGDASYLLMIAGVGIYALCAAARLARFNLEGFVPGTRHFKGLASTLCGAIIPAAVLVSFKYDIPNDAMKLFPVVLLFLGFGMVSNLPLPKVLPRKNKIFNWFQIVNIVFTYVVGIAMVLPEYLLALAVFYLVVGTTHGLLQPPENSVIQSETEG